MKVKRECELTFETYFKKYKKSIHYHIHDLNLTDRHRVYYVAGIFALWKCWKGISKDIDEMIRSEILEVYNKK